jgi:HAD superfamily hydrolase (TIGR01450 family)
LAEEAGAAGDGAGAGARIADRYRALLFDLDGVLYLRDRVIPAAPRAVGELRRGGRALGFITNNSALAPEAVAAKLRRMGVDVGDEEIVTSAHATVHLLGGPATLGGARVLVVGGDGLRAALAGAGATVLAEGDDWRKADTVVVGLDPELTYDRLAAASLAVAAGARFVGSNPDRSLPSADGPLPGAGATLALLAATTGRQPEVAGKPAPALFETAAERVGPGPYLMVGDRVDTDLDGAQRLGWDTALVLTGVTRRAALLDEVTVPPTWLLRDVGGLLGAAQPAIRPPVPGVHDVAALLGAPAGPERSVVAVAADGAVLGALAWDRDGRDATLRGPVVEPATRGEGTGTRLLLAAASRLRGEGVRRLRAAARGGAGFLTGLGFVEAGGGSLVRDVPPPGAQR